MSVLNVLYDLGIAVVGGVAGGLVAYWPAYRATHRAEKEERGEQ